MTSAKMGRNELCWCGSKKKYKHCHLGRESQKPVEHWEVSNEFKKITSKKLCSSPISFHTECSKEIIKAHTIPKSTSLKSIEENGHVYGLNFSHMSYVKNGRKLIHELVGINKASTFSGFCKTHDDAIFSPIEKQRFENIPEHCFLLMYRAFSRELYAKMTSLKLADFRASLDRGKSLEQQLYVQLSNRSLDYGTKLSIRDLSYHKEKLDILLEKKDYSSVKAIVFEFDEPPPVMVAGTIYPDFDFNGCLIQDLMMENIMDFMSVSSFYDGYKGRIVFSWLDYCDETCDRLVGSLLNKPVDSLFVFLIQYVISNFENHFISPKWWGKLTSDVKQKISNMIYHKVSLKTDPDGTSISRIILDVPILKVTETIMINKS